MKKLAEYIKNNCHNLETIFVFPLQVQAREWFIESLNITEKKAFSESMIISWASFKEKFFENDINKKPISQIIRKIFIEYILKKNADAARTGNPIFKKIILQKYAQNSANFSSWLVDILPQLDNLDRKLNSKSYFLPEIIDYLVLKKHYEDFLQRHLLYEPSWIHKNLTLKNENIKIIFPELIEDFYEVSETISQSKNIELISLQNFFDEKKISAIEFENSRVEIEFCISNIEKLLLNGVQANDIAITVCNLDELKPYLNREANLRGIPIEFRAGSQLGKTQIGVFFKQLLNITKTQYSFESLNSFFLNSHLPWKHKPLIYQLLQFGIEHNCVVSWQDGYTWKNCWEEAFQLNENKKPVEQINLENFFFEFKTRVDAIINSKTFQDVKRNYIIFREKFLDLEKLSKADDLILARCVEKLKDLILIEQDFEKELPNNRFSFFVTILDHSNYVFQNTGTSVSVFPIMVMAVSPFKYNFVLNANQKDFKVSFSSLSFLRNDVRKTLQLNDLDADSFFLKCYNECSNSIISFSKKTFSDYTICHNGLQKRSLTGNEIEILKTNSYITEEKYFYDKNTEYNFNVYKLQKLGAKNFIENLHNKKNFSFLKKAFPKETHNLLHTHIKNRNYIDSEKFKISQSQLKVFTECPTKYFFNNVLRVYKNNMPSLLLPIDIGNLSHNILKKLFTKIKEYDSGLNTENLSDYIKLAEEIIYSEVNKNIKINKAFITLLQEKNFDEIVYLLKYVLKNFNKFSIPVIEKTFIQSTGDYFLDGTVDCAFYDERKKTFALIDFKTNVTPKKGEARVTHDNESLSDFQIAMYVLLLEKSFSDTKVTNALFWSLNKKQATEIIKEGNLKDSREMFELSIKNLLHQLEVFCSKMVAYNFTKDKSISFIQCVTCDYKNICRTTFQIEGE